MRKAYIIARNKEVIARYASPDVDYSFIASVLDLRELPAGTEVITVGNWDSRSDYMALRNEIKRRKLILVVGKLI